MNVRKTRKMNTKNENNSAREALKSRIAKAIARGPSQSEIAVKCGVTDQSVYGWKTTGKIGKQSLERLAEATGVSLSWLLTGNGQDCIDGAQGEASTEYRPSGQSEPRGVPLLTWAQAVADHRQIPQFREGLMEFVRVDGRVGARAYAITIDDDTNEPELSIGARAVIDPDETPQSGDFVFVLMGSGEATVKRLRRDGGIDFLCPENQRYPVRPFPADAEILGVVIEVNRRYR